MKNNTLASTAKPIQSGLTLIIGLVCIATSVFGLYWLSKIVPGIFHTLKESGFSFMANSIIFHLVWVVFFISLFITGIKLLISAVKKRSKDLVSGTTLYFLGASLVIIGLFYLLFQEYTYALIAMLSGTLCVYLEGATEIA